jgi:hypothetical protein
LYPYDVSIEASLTADGIGVVYTSLGVLTGQDLLDAGEHFRVESRSNPEIRYVIMDHSAIPEEKVDSVSLKALASRVSEILEPTPEVLMAIVAPNDVLFGLSRMWETLAEQAGFITRVMRTRAEAMAWLEEELTQRQLPFLPTE